MSAPWIGDLSECTEFRCAQEAAPAKVLHALLALVLLSIGALAAWAAVTEVDLVVRVRGRLRPAEAAAGQQSKERVCAARPGRVRNLTVREGDSVHHGDVLLELFADDLERRQRELERESDALELERGRYERMAELIEERHHAAVRRQQAEVERVTADIRQARARREVQVQRADQRLQTVRENLQRAESLAADGIRAQVELRDAAAAVHDAERELEEARLPVSDRALAVLDRDMEVLERELGIERALLRLRADDNQRRREAVASDLAELQREFVKTRLVAPIDGVVTELSVGVGELVVEGAPALRLAPLTGMQMEVRIESRNIAFVETGMRARVRLDAFDPHEYGYLEGHVSYVAPDSSIDGHGRGDGAVTYAVRIELTPDVGDSALRDRLRLGMTGQADLLTGRESLLAVLVGGWKNGISGP